MEVQYGQGEAACPACGRPDVVDESGHTEPHNVYGLASPCECAWDAVRLAVGDSKPTQDHDEET